MLNRLTLASRRMHIGEPLADVVWFTNIPTPYRHHLYRSLARALADQGLSFHVVFMAKREAHRPWNYSREEADYPHSILKGWSTTVAKRPVHVNPGAIRLGRREPLIMVIGGVSNPSAWLAMASATRLTCTLLAAESNVQSQRVSSGVLASVKRWMIRSTDGFLVPGEASLGYIRANGRDPATCPVVLMPNVINETHFPPRESQIAQQWRQEVRQRLSIDEDKLVLLVPARLEPFKGLIDLLEALATLDPSQRPTTLLAGTGSLQAEVQARGPSLGVRHLGQVPDNEMAHLYAASDVFGLVSHRDPSPLSVIEAARSGLPLLLSDAVGNAREALQPGDNGWLVPSGNPRSLAAILREMALTNSSSLQRMGKLSAAIHRQSLSTEVIVPVAARSLASLAIESSHRRKSGR